MGKRVGECLGQGRRCYRRTCLAGIRPLLEFEPIDGANACLFGHVYLIPGRICFGIGVYGSKDSCEHKVKGEEKERKQGMYVL